MNNFIEFKKVMINNRSRILYKQKGHNKLYIKDKGRIIGFTEYKQQYKIKKQKGGVYENGDIEKYSKINEMDNKEYIVNKENISEFEEDPISGEIIPKSQAILFDGKIYNVETLYKWINRTNKPYNSINIVPHTRREFTTDEINNINNLFQATILSDPKELLLKEFKKLIRERNDLYFRQGSMDDYSWVENMPEKLDINEKNIKNIIEKEPSFKSSKLILDIVKKIPPYRASVLFDWWIKDNKLGIV